MASHHAVPAAAAADVDYVGCVTSAHLYWIKHCVFTDHHQWVEIITRAALFVTADCNFVKESCFSLMILFTPGSNLYLWQSSDCYC